MNIFQLDISISEYEGDTPETICVGLYGTLDGAYEALYKWVLAEWNEGTVIPPWLVDYDDEDSEISSWFFDYPDDADERRAPWLADKSHQEVVSAYFRRVHQNGTRYDIDERTVQ